jgi:hypothetical protein
MIYVNNDDLKWLEEILYCEDNERLKQEIKNITEPLFLHIIAANYNWDNGFEIPNAIINNDYCDLGTGLMIFYNADGYRLLQPDIEFSSSQLNEWRLFISKLYNKLLNHEFKIQEISYTPKLSKVQVYKLKKSNPNVPDIFLQKSPGAQVDIPIL